MDLHETAERCLRCTEAADKVARTRAALRSWRTVRDSWQSTDPEPRVAGAALRPGLPARLRLVDPLSVPKRRPGTEAGKKAFVHALAHIELNAVNLAWDCVWRFRGMPRAFYDDWVGVAAEEAEHFDLLQTRLVELGADYGDLPAHDGLWEMAEKTRHDLAARMAMVPRVLEARGLDVTPGMIERMQRQGDERSAAILRVIYEQEIGHVEIGSRWFRHACREQGFDPSAHFSTLLERYMKGRIRGPLNVEARRSAGFSDAELDGLARMTVR
jgi:uncharacterized ferritin-like protein (DUF455 family)